MDPERNEAKRSEVEGVELEACPERNEAKRSEVEGVELEACPERNEAKRSEVEGVWLVYIIECRSGKLYTGMTEDLLRRWPEHLRGGSRFTKGDPPVRVIHVEAFADKHTAALRERQVKGWTRRKKWALARRQLALLKKL